jgi:hypothetical protein
MPPPPCALIEPVGQKKPSAQLPLTAVRPADPQKEPAVQLVHCAALTSDVEVLKVPAGHGSGAPVPSGQ